MVVCAAAMCAGTTPVRAWGGDGHRIVARVAERELTPAARAEVTRLLALEPVATLESVSTWADETRSHATAHWHYVNFPRNGACDFAAAPLCMEGMCVVTAIERQTAVLASAATDEARLKALKYVVHFVADVHQPLHAGYADDRGGNQYQVYVFGRGTNLHAVWDSALVAHWPGGADALLEAAEEEARAMKVSGGRALAPAAWAEESCRIVGSQGFYPDGHKLDPEYAQRWAPTLVHQLAFAGKRLAALLNATLSRP